MRSLNIWALVLPKRRHLLLMVISTFLLLMALYVVTINSEDYETAKKFVAQDTRVASVIGKVKRVGFKVWDGFESVGGNGGYAKYSFSVTSDKGEFVIEVRLNCVGDVWNIKAADIRTRDGTQSHINVHVGG